MFERKKQIAARTRSPETLSDRFYLGRKADDEAADMLRLGVRRKQPSGVNVCGYLRTESGVGAAARAYIRALESVDVPVALHDLSSLSGNRAENPIPPGFVTGQPFDINVVCVDIEKHTSILSQFGNDFFTDRYNVGVWWWEVEIFPHKWRDRFAYYDEIWAASSFIANNLAPISPVPVVRVPPVLTLERYGSRERGRRLLGVGQAEFLFLLVFDFNSTTARKNPDAAIDAFKRAFAVSEPVRLVIKSVNGARNERGLAELRAQCGSHPVTIIDGYWPVDDVQDLIAACDAYVSLHRSEGIGLTITDAMAHGKPVVATGWSGNMDVMSTRNSFPVEYDLVEIGGAAGQYANGGRWANPSVEHAAKQLRYVFSHADIARARGEAARQDIELGYSPEAIGRLIAARLETIHIRRRWPAFKRKSLGAFTAYRRMIRQVVETTSTVLPQNATVLVVSRGDPALLELPGQRAWHFPQLESGAYAGYYPADSADAIAHFEQLREKGAEYLLIPRPAFWWLDHYKEFANHLSRYELCCRHDACLIFSLRNTGSLGDTPSRLRTMPPRAAQPKEGI